MRFLADMGVATRVVDWLRQNGHDAKHLRDEGYIGFQWRDFCESHL